MADLDPRFLVPCRHWIGAERRRCGATPTRRYLQGPACRDHTPSALAGRPEPGQGAHCPPGICWCGGCPSWREQSAYPAHSAIGAVIDARAIASGKRRSSPAVFRAAQLLVQPHPNPERTP